MNFLLRMLTWWNSQTLNTQFHTWRHGKKVGEDDQGNIFYESRDGKRRWVIYNGETEASRISPDWHGWLHHTWSETPAERPLVHKSWQKPHAENPTGTPAAYLPAGSMRRTEPAQRRDYDAWSPE
ncbi:MAG: NADH:ubiquinone oxidoreductase subunit NDUFA12 [Pararhodobacter sp.]|nr:NADH:ubiquinone oxidoreductase subunit NDUFA12 [Pararhodobacter sp.]